MRKKSDTNWLKVPTAAALIAVIGMGVVTVPGPLAAQTPARDFASMSAEADSIERHNSYTQRMLGTQLTEIDSLVAQIQGIDVTGATLLDGLQRMFDGLDRFVSTDLPFLQKERSERIERLRTMMADTETPAAEKYRKLLEAYQIELDYGRTMESYAGTIEGKGDVNFLRLGRVSLMYATPDGLEAGYWDAAKKEWVEDSDEASNIVHAVRIARQEVTADLITVPVPAGLQGK